MLRPAAVGSAEHFILTLNALKQRAEARLAGGKSQYVSRKHSRAIYVGSDPRESYFIFSTLKKYLPDMEANAGRVVGVGTGLAVNEYTFNNLFPKVKEIVAMDVDPALIREARAIGAELGSRYGYDLSAVKCRRQDVLRADLSGFDAALIWAPLARDISDRQLLQVFRHMRPGTRLIQMSNWHPLSIMEDNEAKGFRVVHPGYPGYLPAAVFERIA